MKIDAAVLNEPEDIEITSLSLDGPRADEVLVDVVATGVCHSDYDQYVGETDGPCPMVLGHEGAGVVEATGDGVTVVDPGDHVVLAVMPFCGLCRHCESGRPYLCERGNDVAFAGTMMDGTRRLSDDGPVNHFFAQSSFATKAVVHESAAVPIDEDVPFEKAALLGCGAMTGLGGVLNTAAVTAGESLAVFGCGGVGMSAVMAANAVNAEPIITVDVVPEKLDTTENLGATHTVDATAREPVAEIDSIVPGGVDYAFEFVGNAETMRQAFEAIRPGGTAVITGAETGDELSVDPMEFLDDKRLIGNLVGSCRPHVDIPRFVDMHNSGAIDLGALHTQTLTLSDLEVAFDGMEAGEGIRTVLSLE